MLAGGSRIAYHLRECDHCFFGLGLGFYRTRIIQLSFASPPNPSSSTTVNPATHHLLLRSKKTSSPPCHRIQSKSPGEFPTLSSCFRFVSILLRILLIFACILLGCKEFLFGVIAKHENAGLVLHTIDLDAK